MKLHEFFDSRTKWNRRVTGRFGTAAYAVNKTGKSVRTFSPDACSFCLFGAIDRLELDSEEIKARFAKIGISNPARWSDRRCPDFATFRSTLKELDI